MLETAAEVVRHSRCHHWPLRRRIEVLEGDSRRTQGRPKIVQRADAERDPAGGVDVSEKFALFARQLPFPRFALDGQQAARWRDDAEDIGDPLPPGEGSKHIAPRIEDAGGVVPPGTNARELQVVETNRDEIIRGIRVRPPRRDRWLRLRFRHQAELDRLC